MSKYFIDTEFLEGVQKKSFWNFSSQLNKPTIDLISIGIVSEEGKELYLISNEFNVDEAWNRYQLEDDNTVGARIGALPPKKKVYWLRENVLLPIFYELAFNDFHNIHFDDEWRKFGTGESVTYEVFKKDEQWSNDLKWFKKLLKKYGYSNEYIGEEIIRFVGLGHFDMVRWSGNDYYEITDEIREEYIKKVLSKNPIEFYGYYADYDWVVFCWSFGNMLSLPKGFPMYCRDLKQMLDEKKEFILNRIKEHPLTLGSSNRSTGEMNYDVLFDKPTVKENSIQFDLSTFDFKKHPDYPKQTNEHNALADARWNRELYKFIKS